MAKSRRRNVGSADVSTAMPPSLPQDLILDILSRLPAKQLWGFRFVSTTWFKLLTQNPEFAKMHSDRSIQTHQPLHILASKLRRPRSTLYLATEYTSCDKPTLLQPPFLQECNNEYEIWGTCNGLVCLSSPTKKQVYIFNPLTTNHIVVPYQSINPPHFPANHFHFKDDAFAFGLYQTLSGYKIVRRYIELGVGQLRSHLQLSVYTLGEDSSWRILQQDTSNEFGIVRSRPELVNGILHWIALKLNAPHPGAVICFDLKDEVCRHMLLPSDVVVNYKHCPNILMELDGLLGLYTKYKEDPIHIWVMKEYGVVNSWIKQFTIQIPEICQSLSWIKPLAARNGELMLMTKTDLIIYNPETNSIRKLKGFKFQWKDVYAYVGSIVSPRVTSEDISRLQSIMK